MKNIIIAAVILFLAPLAVSAHSGGTDANNGHHCWTNCEAYGLQDGEYHFHDADDNAISTYDNNQDVFDKGLAERLHGQILLQVEEHGEAYYIRSNDSMRYYMKDGAAAYTMMRFFSIGITDNDLSSIPSVSDTTEMNESASACGTNSVANRLRGEILLQVEQHGEAWYIHPEKCRRIYMKDGAEAYQIMRFLGLGIINVDLEKIPVGQIDNELSALATPTTSLHAAVENRAHDVIDVHRNSLGVKSLVWSDDIANIARVHSENMANGVIEPSHDGFDQRVTEIKVFYSNYNGGAENLAWNYSSDPAQQALDWWLTSPGHKSSLENDFYDVTGIGVAQADDGRYYITQMFINID